MNHIKVLFFATLRDKAGTKTIEVDIKPGATIQDLKNILVQRFPGIQEVIDHSLASINHEYSDETTEIPSAAEIAFFPPVSGGQVLDFGL